MYLCRNIQYLQTESTIMKYPKVSSRVNEGTLVFAVFTCEVNLYHVIEVMSKPVYLILGIISTVSNLMILIFCLQDSNPLPNKYGESHKYC